MSTPVIANEWAGNFECSGPCRRKRLMGEEFSKKAMERHLKQNAPLKCKKCIEEVQAAERAAAAAKKPATTSTADASQSTRRICASCQQSLPESAYNKNQWRNKPEGQSKCRTCVEKSLANEQAAQSNKAATDLQEAERAVAAAQTPHEKLKAESRLSALQAEKVTGLKPVRLGRGRGRGGGGSGGRGRGGRGRGSAGRSTK